MSEKEYVAYGHENEEFYLQHVKRSEVFDIIKHYHENYEIYYLIAGHRTYFIKDRSYLVNPGDLVFINKNDVHKTSNFGPSGHERVLINFSDQFIHAPQLFSASFLLMPFQRNINVMHLDQQEQGFIGTLFSKMFNEAQEQSNEFKTYLKLLLVELLIFAGRYIEKTEVTPFEHVSPLHQKISEMVRYINRNYAHRMTLSELSVQFFISPYYLTRTFKEITGFTIVEYINMTRIKEAQKLLKESDAKIIEIAECVGFENITHFGRVFKKLTKVTPLKYRKMSDSFMNNR